MSILAGFKNIVNPLFGLRAEGEGNYEPTPLKAMREITNLESFGAILPYCAFYEAEGLFVLDTGERDQKNKSEALGFAIEITPQTGATEEMIRVLAPIFANAPIGSNIQVSLYGSSRVIGQMKTAAVLGD